MRDASTYERRLSRLAAAYMPLAAGGAAMSLRHRVGAHPGGDPARDLAFRGTGLAPPLFLPVALLAAANMTRRRDRLGAAAAGVVTAVGLAFTAGSTINLPNDVAAARDAGTPVSWTVGFAAFHWVFGPALVWNAIAALRSRKRRP